MTNSANNHQTGLHGGGGGAPFSDQLPDGARVCGVRIRHGQYVDGIQLSWVTADGTRVDGPYHGGQGGSEDSFTLAPGEQIDYITGRSGDLVDQLNFFTSLNNRYGPYGGDGGDDFVVSLRAGIDPLDESPEAKVIHPLTGICGRSGDLLDAIGFWLYLELPGG